MTTSPLFKRMPVEATDEMSLAGRKALAIIADRMETAKLTATSIIDFWQIVGHKPADEIYRAMLVASPEPAESEKNSGDARSTGGNF